MTKRVRMLRLNESSTGSPLDQHNGLVHRNERELEDGWERGEEEVVTTTREASTDTDTEETERTIDGLDLLNLSEPSTPESPRHRISLTTESGDLSISGSMNYDEEHIKILKDMTPEELTKMLKSFKDGLNLSGSVRKRYELHQIDGWLEDPCVQEAILHRLCGGAQDHIQIEASEDTRPVFSELTMTPKGLESTPQFINAIKRGVVLKYQSGSSTGQIRAPCTAPLGVQWKKQMLMFDMELNRLFFFKHLADVEPKCSINLDHMTYVGQGSFQGKDCINIQTTTESGFNTHYVCVEDPVEKMSWISILEFNLIFSKTHLLPYAKKYTSGNITITDPSRRISRGQTSVSEQKIRSGLYHQQNWMPDSEASKCWCCRVEFTFYRRRHHCRSCGLIFCNHCSRFRLNLAYLGLGPKEERVCISCYEMHTPLHSILCPLQCSQKISVKTN